MKLLRFVFVTLVLATTYALAQNPVPFIDQPLVPTAVAPGGTGLTLTVNGAGFVSGSVVNWNGTPLTTVFVSSAQLQATVPAANAATAQTASITVVNPLPGGGTSSTAFFQVTSPESSVLLTAKGSATSNILGEVTADFNGDGKLDVAIYTFSPSQISILLGKGDGTFQAPVSYTVQPSSTQGLVAGDFNGDGKLDLVIGLSLLLGNGDGTFQQAVPLTGLSGVVSTTGDFNRDGKLDLLGPASQMDFFIALGNGDGTFQPATTFGATCDRDLSTGVTASFTNSGKLDMFAQGNDGGQCVFLGNGDGTFSSPLLFGLGLTFVIADFNGDGKQDVVFDGQGVGLSIALGNGDGTFQAAQALNATGCGGSSTGTFYVPAGDFNGDGKLDFALGNCIFLGNDDGTFQPGVAYPQVNGFTGAGDFNGDGKLDLLGDGTIVLLQSSDFSLAASPTSRTVTAGQSTSYSLTILPLGGFNNTVALSCMGAPTGSTCTISPGQVSLDGSHPATATVTVMTSMSSAELTRPRGTMLARSFAMVGTFGLVVLVLLPASRTRRRFYGRYLLALVCLISIGVSLPACGGGNSSVVQTPTTGTFKLTVTGTFAGSTQVMHSVPLTLVVQ